MRWNIRFEIEHVPCPPGHEYAYRAIIRDMALCALRHKAERLAAEEKARQQQQENAARPASD